MFESIPWYWDITMIIGYLVIGYGLTMGFRLWFLDDGKWGDGPFTLSHALIMTLLWPFAAALLLIIVIACLVWIDIPNFLRKIYRLEDKCNKA